MVQRYIENPMLIGGKKFDLRLYALVTSYSPLQVYIYRNGFARFSSFRYNSNVKNIGDSYVHLTNASVQKSAPGFDKTVPHLQLSCIPAHAACSPVRTACSSVHPACSPVRPACRSVHTACNYLCAQTGCKWGLRNLKLYLISKYGAARTDQLFKEIEDVVVYSLLAVQAACASGLGLASGLSVSVSREREHERGREHERVGVRVQKVMINDKHCFEMYGYDVMIDDNLKPWLIEVNSSPSVTADTPTDYELKFGLLDDVWTILDVEGKLGGVVEPVVGGFDLVYNNGPVKPDKSACYTTRLGCYEDRVRQLKKMHKQHAKRVAAVA